MPADRALAPSDAAVALRSFPRRFRGVLASPGEDDSGDDPDEVARRAGQAGLTAAEHLVTADAVVVALADALRSRDAAVEFPATLADDGTAVSTLLDRFAETAARAADAVDAVASDDWDDLLRPTQDAVGTIADHLRAAEQVISEVV